MDTYHVHLAGLVETWALDVTTTEEAVRSADIVGDAMTPCQGRAYSLSSAGAAVRRGRHCMAVKKPQHPHRHLCRTCWSRMLVLSTAQWRAFAGTYGEGDEDRWL